jgi:hypothetical protein
MFNTKPCYIKSLADVEREHAFKRHQDEVYGHTPQDVMLVKASFSPQELEHFHKVWDIIGSWSPHKINGVMAKVRSIS